MDQERRLKELVLRPGLIWLFGAFCLLLVGVVFAYQVLTPSDGARIDKSPQAWDNRGIHLHTYSVASGLQANDFLVAIDGEPIGSIINKIFKPGRASSELSVGQVIEYQVLRDGELLSIPVRLAYQPILAILAAHWGVLLYAAATQILIFFVFLRRPNDPTAASVFIWAMTGSHFYVWSLYRQVPDILTGYGFWLYTVIASFLWLSNWAAGVQLALTFPRPLPVLVKRPGWLYVPYLAVFFFIIAYFAITRIYISNTLEWIDSWGQGESLAAIGLFLPTVAIILHQYRRDRSESSRKKIRFVVFSGLTVGSLTVLFYLLPPFFGLPGLDANFVGVILLLFPASMAIAILRYQLFDIDLIIRRTLIYSSLTFSLVLIYFVSVVTFQQAFRSISGQAADSQVAIVLSTLVIAALFNPFRRRIQEFIDRRFFRRRYDVAQTLESFAVLLRDEVDIDQLSMHLLSVVEETVQPETASLWMARLESTTPKK